MTAENVQGNAATKHYVEQSTRMPAFVVNGGSGEDRRNKDTRDKGYDTTY
jgi:hypothetical protein